MNDGPAYGRMVDELREAIRSGELTGRLPSLISLADRYGVAPAIARKAVDILRAEGLITHTRQGARPYVRQFQRITRRSPDRLSREQWGAGKAIQDADTGIRPRAVDVTVGETPAPHDVAEALGVEPGAPVLTRDRRFLVEQRPVQLATSYLPLDFADTRLAYTDVGAGGTYARLAELGHAPARFVERVTARVPRPDEVERLGLASAVGTVVLEIVRHAYTDAGRCVEVNRMILDATTYDLEYAFPAE
ncbi:GntR family transcriptional regulator [Dactylosporangium sp. CA-152071]|uniref:GntR family transcriptional regulator n=1 Tax=Dactylosporangium sp. CA-152071 TaxID=3239933 RepID=UPI003D8AA4D3